MKRISTSVLRNVGHPWQGGDSGWDLMFMKSQTEAIEREALEIADGAGWKVLVNGFDDADEPDSRPMLVLFKPHGVPRRDADKWADPHPWPAPDLW